MHFVAIALSVFLSTVALAAPHKFTRMNGPNVGQEYSTDDFKGQNVVYVYEFYSNGCGMCNQNAPELALLQETFKDRPEVQILNVGLDRNQSDYDAWRRKHGDQVQVVKDTYKVADTFSFRFIPQVYVLDCNLNIVLDFPPNVWSSSDHQAIQKVIEDTLKSQTCS